MKLRNLFLGFATSTLILILLASWASGAETTVPVADVSASGSPFAFSGTVVMAETIQGEKLVYHFAPDVVGKNISSKTILTMVAGVELLNSYGQGKHHVTQAECFFAEDVIRPGDEHVILKPVEGVYEVPIGPSPERMQPKAEVKVLYVQFLDGSVFGDETAAADLLRMRRIAWQELKRLSQTYKTKGEQAFLAALQETMSPPEVDTFIGSVRNTQARLGTVAAVQQVEEQLALAKEHNSLLEGTAPGSE